MTRIAGFAASAAVLGLLATPVAAQKTIESTPVSITATIEKVDKATRVVTLKGPKGNIVDVKAPDDMQGFDTLKVGDAMNVSYYEALAVNIRKPGTPPPSTEARTTVTRKELTPGGKALREQTFTVKVDAVDVAASTVVVTGPRGNTVPLKVADTEYLKTLKAGDTVDITYYESLAISFAKPKK